jgi:hypothetical protein
MIIKFKTLAVFFYILITVQHLVALLYIQDITHKKILFLSFLFYFPFFITSLAAKATSVQTEKYSSSHLIGLYLSFLSGLLFYFLNKNFSLSINFFQENISVLRGDTLDHGLNIYTRFIGYLSIISTIIYIRLRMNGASLYHIIIPLLSSTLYVFTVYGKGIAIINLAVLFCFETISCKRFLKNFLIFVVLLLCTITIDFSRGLFDSLEDLKIYFLYYFESPIFGSIIAFENVFLDNNFCITPILVATETCTALDSSTFLVPWGVTETNVYGSFGWLIATAGIFGAILYSTMMCLFVYFVCNNFTKLKFKSIALYCIISVATFSFYMPVVLFNGFYAFIFLTVIVDLCNIASAESKRTRLN